MVEKDPNKTRLEMSITNYNVNNKLFENKLDKITGFKTNSTFTAHKYYFISQLSGTVRQFLFPFTSLVLQWYAWRMFASGHV